ncbi:MAG TPA: hypothetical protein VK445_06815, partial [Dissulfurispiraceae bacterium]|nr:hypothetical protein [Dissulfurispiraceae bacterium]
FVKIGIALKRGNCFLPGPHKLLVLHLELNLMHLQFMEEALRFRVVRYAAALPLRRYLFLGPTAKVDGLG